MLPLPSLCLSSDPSLLNEREPLVSLRLTASSAGSGKMRREKERADEGKAEEREKREEAEQSAA